MNGAFNIAARFPDIPPNMVRVRYPVLRETELFSKWRRKLVKIFKPYFHNSNLGDYVQICENQFQILRRIVQLYSKFCANLQEFQTACIF